MREALTIVICGTPGTGKTRLVHELEKALPKFNTVNISNFAKEKDCVSEYDETLDTFVIDEEKLEEKLEGVFKEKKLNIIESIHADFIPKSRVDLIYVCRTDSTKLFDRLHERNYSENKITNNVEAEIFQTILDETKEHFSELSITELVNNDELDLKNNSKIILESVEKLLNT